MKPSGCYGRRTTAAEALTEHGVRFQMIDYAKHRHVLTAYPDQFTPLQVRIMNFRKPF